MKFTWSQYERVTTCNCKRCSFQKHVAMFVSRCSGGCHCYHEKTTKCIPGFFGIVDRNFKQEDGTSPLATWSGAAAYFQNNMCVVRGGHPYDMCAKMKCEAFGGEDCGGDGVNPASHQSWRSTKAANASFEPDP